MTTPATTQTPKTLTVTSANPVWLGKNAPGTQKEIVNDANNRVWLGPDSNVRINAGIPVNGLTAVSWNAIGDIYAIREPNRDSAGNVTTVGTGDVHISDVTTGWEASPIDVGVAVAVQLLATGLPFIERKLPLNGAGVEDITAYSSVLGNVIGNAKVGATNLGTGVGMVEFLFDFTNSAVVGDMKTYRVRLTTIDPVPVRIPILGDRVTVFIAYYDPAGTFMVGPADAVPAFSLYASSRVVPKAQIGLEPIVDSLANPTNPGHSSSDGTLLFQQASILANQNVRWFLPCYQGRVAVTFGAGAAAMNVFFRFGVPVGSTGHVIGPLGHAAGAADTVTELAFPSEQCQVEMNFGASPGSGHIVVTALDL